MIVLEIEKFDRQTRRAELYVQHFDTAEAAEARRMFLESRRPGQLTVHTVLDTRTVDDPAADVDPLRRPNARIQRIAWGGITEDEVEVYEMLEAAERRARRSAMANPMNEGRRRRYKAAAAALNRWLAEPDEEEGQELKCP